MKGRVRVWVRVRGRERRDRVHVEMTAHVLVSASIFE